MKKSILIFIPIIILITSNFAIIHAEYSEENDFPISFSWSNVEGIDYTTPIQDQSPAPTCEAYALCASLETIIQYQEQEIFSPDLSETHLYFYAGGTYQDGRVNLIDAADYLVDFGVPDEGCYPDPHRAYDYPFTSLEGWENRTVKINEWGWVNNTIEDIKESLIKYGPLIFCAYFWNDFYAYREGVYEQKLEPYASGHVMTITGYDDNEQCWIVKNSWGSSWGLDGWLKMSYDANMITDDWYLEYDENCTGIIYLNGAYGNFHPGVPKVYISNMDIKKTYFFEREFPIILRNFPFFTAATSRIIGDFEVEVDYEMTPYVEFYIDGEFVNIDDDPPYNCVLETDRGRHTLTVIGYNKNGFSQDIRDFYKII